MPHLIVVSGVGPAQPVDVGDAPLTIGRHFSCQLQLWDSKVSREHARIEKQHGVHCLVDLASRNGTFLNGERVRSARLSGGDRIRIGDTVFAFLLEGKVSFSQSEQTGFVTFVDASLRTQNARILSASPPPDRQAPWQSAQAAVEVLQRLAQLAAAAHEPDLLMDAALDLALELVGADRGFISLAGAPREVQGADPGSFVLKASRPRTSVPEEVSLSRTILDYAVKKGESVLCSDLASDSRFTGRQSVKAHRMKSAIYVPLKVQDAIAGMLGVDTPDPRKRFSEDHLQYLSVFGNHLALALQNVELRRKAETRRLIEVQLQTAREIQASFLPADPISLKGLAYAARMLPAMEVGGDFYDWMLLRDGRIVFAIGDVSGKGVPAALSMARIMGCLRGLTATLDRPEEIARALNKSLLDCGIAGGFTTMVLAVCDPRTRALELCVAGHPQPIIHSPARRCSEVFQGDFGPPLGISEETEWPRATIRLVPGDLLVFYTDGLIESRGKVLGTKPLQQAVEKFALSSPDDLIDGVFESVLPAGVGHDDATLLALTIK